MRAGSPRAARQAVGEVGELATVLPGFCQKIQRNLPLSREHLNFVKTALSSTIIFPPWNFSSLHLLVSLSLLVLVPSRADQP